MARSSARDVVFRLLFARELGGGDDFAQVAEMSEIALNQDDQDYALDILDGCTSRLDELDTVIARLLRGWHIDRLTRVDLSLLRLAAYEVLYRTDIPASVSVSEAVLLAQRYSSDEAPSFVNGVLGALAREIGKE